MPSTTPPSPRRNVSPRGSTASDPIGYSLGFVFATGSLHVAGIAIGSLAVLPRGETFLRGLGGVVLGIGLYFMWAAWP